MRDVLHFLLPEDLQSSLLNRVLYIAKYERTSQSATLDHAAISLWGVFGDDGGRIRRSLTNLPWPCLHLCHLVLVTL